MARSTGVGAVASHYSAYLAVAVPIVLCHNLLHEATHYLAAVAYGEKVLALRFLTNGWGTSQVVYATPVEERTGAYWLVIAWAPSAVTTMAGYLVYWYRQRSCQRQTTRRWLLYAGFFFLLLDPLYLSVLSLLVGGDVRAVDAVGWPAWPVQAIASLVLIVNWRLFRRWQRQEAAPPVSRCASSESWANDAHAKP